MKEKRPVYFLNGIKEIIIYSQNPDELANFYSKILGYGIKKEDQDILVLLGNSNIRIKRGENSTTKYHLGFSIIDIWTNALVQNLKIKKVDFIQKDSSFLLKDPIGNEIEIKIESQKPRARITHSKNQTKHQQENKWEYVYKNLPFKKLPWYYENIDFDIQLALSRYLPLPSSILDVGCGPGTQAARLCAIGYKVTAIDIAKEAINKAQEIYSPLDINFLQKDITDKSITELGTFDGAIDRGCFHSLSPEQHDKYINNISFLLKSKGILILKVFSKEEPGNWGPRRFEIEELIELFLPKFKLISFEKSAFEGGRSYPKALCLVLEKNLLAT